MANAQLRQLFAQPIHSPLTNKHEIFTPPKESGKLIPNTISKTPSSSILALSISEEIYGDPMHLRCAGPTPPLSAELPAVRCSNVNSLVNTSAFSQAPFASSHQA